MEPQTGGSRKLARDILHSAPNLVVAVVIGRRISKPKSCLSDHDSPKQSHFTTCDHN